jgi:hypothetical protein
MRLQQRSVNKEAIIRRQDSNTSQKDPRTSLEFSFQLGPKRETPYAVQQKSQTEVNCNRLPGFFYSYPAPSSSES